MRVIVYRVVQQWREFEIPSADGKTWSQWCGEYDEAWERFQDSDEAWTDTQDTCPGMPQLTLMEIETSTPKNADPEIDCVRGFYRDAGGTGPLPYSSDKVCKHK